MTKLSTKSLIKMIEHSYLMKYHTLLRGDRRMKTDSIFEFKDGNLNEYIDEIIDQLPLDNFEYKKIQNAILNILESFPSITDAFEDGNYKSFNKQEIEALIKLYNLYREAKSIELKKVFYIGASNNCYYMKNIGLIEEI